MMLNITENVRVKALMVILCMHIIRLQLKLLKSYTTCSDVHLCLESHCDTRQDGDKVDNVKILWK